jgi:hypothetical protein
MIGLASGERVLVDLGDLLPCFVSVALHEVLDQHRNVFFPFPERRHIDWENIQPVEEVGAKGSGSNRSRQIAVGSGDNSNISRNGAAASHSFKLAVLDDAKQRNLRFRRKFADFIEKNRAGVRQFKPALPALEGSGECSPSRVQIIPRR